MRALKKFFIFIFISSFYFLLASKVKAVCPVCTIAIGAGLGLSRFLGIDDTISGIWIGGFLTSLSLWLANWFMKKYKPKVKKIYITLISFLINFCLIFILLGTTRILGHPYNKLLGIDKLVFGSIFGVATLFLAVFLDKKVRRFKGKELFEYQKVVFPVILLAIISIIFYFLTR